MCSAEYNFFLSKQNLKKCAHNLRKKEEVIVSTKGQGGLVASTSYFSYAVLLLLEEKKFPEAFITFHREFWRRGGF